MVAGWRGRASEALRRLVHARRILADFALVLVLAVSVSGADARPTEIHNDSLPTSTSYVYDISGYTCRR